MTEDKAARIPVIIAVGEVNDRPAVDVEGRESIALMLAALQAAEQELGHPILDRIDWLGVEDQISFPDPDIHDHLADLLPKRPARTYRTFEASGDGPIRMINEAANMIARGEIAVAATVGAEAMRTATKRAQAAALAASQAPVTEKKADKVADSSVDYAPRLARLMGVTAPTDVYPLYENAARAAWGQTLEEAQQESATIWSGFSKVAEDNPAAWLRRAVPPETISEVTADNRLISFPYTKLMVANSAVNQGAAVIVTSLAVARALGVPEDRLIYPGAGASAQEPKDFFNRDVFTRSASLETTIRSALEMNGVTTGDIDHVELYSCFPCIPKMARRVLDWPIDRPHSVYGGLTFGGGPIGNCMMHAAAAMVRKLRAGGRYGLIVANGGYATQSHSMLFSRAPVPEGTFPQDFDVQAAADAHRGPIPAMLEEHVGEGTIETFTIPFDRRGAPRFGVVVARTPAGERFLAHVPNEDAGTLDFLMASATPVGASGRTERDGEGRIVWRR